MTLESVGFSVPVLVTGFAGLSEIDQTRLDGLGLRLGVTVTKILKTPLQDPIECLVGTQLLAIEARLLPRVRVEAV